MLVGPRSNHRATAHRPAASAPRAATEVPTTTVPVAVTPGSLRSVAETPASAKRAETGAAMLAQDSAAPHLVETVRRELQEAALHPSADSRQPDTFPLLASPVKT